MSSGIIRRANHLLRALAGLRLLLVLTGDKGEAQAVEDPKYLRAPNVRYGLNAQKMRHQMDLR